MFVLAVVVSAGPSAAQESPTVMTPDGVQRSAVEAAVSNPPRSSVAEPARRRPAVLLPLFGGHAALQALDFDSTRRALARGQAREANPAARALGGGVWLISAKTAVTGAVILAGEKMRKKHPRAAVVFVAALDAVMTTVVIHNYRNAGAR